MLGFVSTHTHTHTHTHTTRYSCVNLQKEIKYLPRLNAFPISVGMLPEIKDPSSPRCPNLMIQNCINFETKYMWSEKRSTQINSPRFERRPTDDGIDPEIYVRPAAKPPKHKRTDWDKGPHHKESCLKSACLRNVPKFAKSPISAGMLPSRPVPATKKYSNLRNGDEFHKRRNEKEKFPRNWTNCHLPRLEKLEISVGIDPVMPVTKSKFSDSGSKLQTNRETTSPERVKIICNQNLPRFVMPSINSVKFASMYVNDRSNLLKSFNGCNSEWSRPSRPVWYKESSSVQRQGTILVQMKQRKLFNLNAGILTKRCQAANQSRKCPS